MSNVDDESTISRLTVALQVVVGALTAGLLVFLAIIAAIRAANEAKPLGPRVAAPRVTPIAVGLAGAGLVASVLVPRAVVAGARRRIARGTWSRPVSRDGGPTLLPAAPPSDVAKLASVYQTQLMLGAVLTVGPAFLALIAYLLEGAPLALGAALALLVALIARFPTRARLEHWIEQQVQWLIQERQFGD